MGGLKIGDFKIQELAPPIFAHMRNLAPLWGGGIQALSLNIQKKTTARYLYSAISIVRNDGSGGMTGVGPEQELDFGAE